MSLPQHISSLNIPSDIIKNIIEKGYHTVHDVYNNNEIRASLNLEELTRIPETKTALQLLEDRKSSKCISSLIKNLDEILDSVLNNGLITEFVGLPGSGRTQLWTNQLVTPKLPNFEVIYLALNKNPESFVLGLKAVTFSLHLSISAQIIENSICGETAYICTNMNFSVSRLKEIARNYIRECEQFRSSTIDSILQRIHYANVVTVNDLQIILEEFESFLINHKTVNLVIIDSITYPLRQVESKEKTPLIYSIIQRLRYLAKKYNFTVNLVIIDSITYPLRQVESKEKTPLIYSIIQRLRYLAKKYNFTVILTNDMTTIVGISDSCVVPSLRDTFYHMINNRLILSNMNNTFQAELLKSSVKFPVECFFNFLDSHVNTA